MSSLRRPFRPPPGTLTRSEIRPSSARNSSSGFSAGVTESGTLGSHPGCRLLMIAELLALNIQGTAMNTLRPAACRLAVLAERHWNTRRDRRSRGQLRARAAACLHAPHRRAGRPYRPADRGHTRPALQSFAISRLASRIFSDFNSCHTRLGGRGSNSRPADYEKYGHVLRALAAPMARVIAPMALAALRLPGNPVHKPVHALGPFALPSCYCA